MNQTTFFDGPPTGRHPASREAAEKIRPAFGTRQRRVLDYVAASGGRGWTRHEIAGGLRLPLASICSLVRTLIVAGLLVESGERRPTGGGCTASVVILARPDGGGPRAA